MSALDLEAIAGRLHEALASLSLDGRQFCAGVGIPYSTTRTYLSGIRPPSPDLLAAMHRAYGISAVWVLTGSGSMYGEGGGSEGVNAAMAQPFQVQSAYLTAEPEPPALTRADRPPRIGGTARDDDGRNTVANALLTTAAETVRPLVLSVTRQGRDDGQVRFHVIPKRLKPASAGSGIAALAEPDAVDPIGEIAFAVEWLRSNLGDARGLLTSVRVQGDSMFPTLADGETIIIDEGVKHIDADGIYVMDVNGRRVIKRVQHFVDGSLELISDNAAYRKETLSGALARNVRVLGRMVWPRVR